MNEKISCFLSYNTTSTHTINDILKTNLTGKTYQLSPSSISQQKNTDSENLIIESPYSSNTIHKISELSENQYTLIALNTSQLTLGQFAINRMIEVAKATDAAMVYADYYLNKNEQIEKHGVINYQKGSLRDDFDFGPVQLWKTSILKDFAKLQTNYKYAGYYSLRLFSSTKGNLVHIPEFLFTQKEIDNRKSGEKIFDYVSPSNRERQLEMERACTEHLKRTGAFLKPNFTPINLNQVKFKTEATVIIPVYNRAKTIIDAVNSVLSQKTNFPFNLIVIDNHSTDGTTELLRKIDDERLIAITPKRKDLGIGGCWNEGIFNNNCGKFAIQLDSDDIYANENTLQKIVDKFYEEKCAMVIGSYQLTDFNLKPIPPGIIDHKEWTPENGRNNALRINGLGAPRAFYTPIIRKIKFPNVSYGEDYAVGLAISRKYQIGRIYESLYICRRWEENSDASLNVEKMNAHNTYKDWIRTVELQARIQKNNPNQ